MMIGMKIAFSYRCMYVCMYVYVSLRLFAAHYVFWAISIPGFVYMVREYVLVVFSLHTPFSGGIRRGVRNSHF